MSDWYYMNFEKLAKTKMSPSERSALIYLLSIVKEDNVAYATLADVSTETNMTIQTASLALRSMESSGIIERVGNGRIKISEEVVSFEGCEDE